MSIEPREYQLFIISRILQAKSEGKNVIVELDAGMGKRVISYLLTKYLEKGEKLLFITPSRASVRDTYNFFKEKSDSSELGGKKVGYIGSNMSRKYREYVIKNSDIVIVTPITLANILEKSPELRKFDYIFINEVDKAVRRTAHIPYYDNVKDYLSSFQLVYPWPKLKRLLPKDACWVGLSGTLRDYQTLRVEDDVIFKRDLETIAELLFPEEKPIDFIFMDSILKLPETHKYVVKNMTIIKTIPVRDDKIKLVLDALTDEIYNVTRILASRYTNENDPIVSSEKIERIISKLPSDDVYKIKFLRLALVRKFVTASIPRHYRRFLRRPSIVRLIRNMDENFNVEDLTDSSKVRKIVDIAEEWVKRDKKIAVLTSYIVTARDIKEKLEKKNVKTYIITGKTPNKGEIIEQFKKHGGGAVLILTPVGERDLDLPNVELLLVHDIINTVKTMYQRFKRGRRAFVAILYYEDTYEKNKVSKLLQRIKERYPWSIIVD